MIFPPLFSSHYNSLNDILGKKWDGVMDREGKLATYKSHTNYFLEAIQISFFRDKNCISNSVSNLETRTTYIREMGSY